MIVNAGKNVGRFLPASGVGVNKGRIAGGAEFIRKLGSVFSHRQYPSPAHGNRPGGLIDKRQQVDPSSTIYGHPFDGSDYRPTATSELVPPITGFEVTMLLNPLTHQVPEIMPNQRGRFWREKLKPSVKTIGGTNKSGKESDTPFHPKNKVVVPNSMMRTATEMAKFQNKHRLPSFSSNGNLWNQANHSFIAGRVNTITGDVGAGRWHTVKRSVV